MFTKDHLILCEHKKVLISHKRNLLLNIYFTLKNAFFFFFFIYYYQFLHFTICMQYFTVSLVLRLQLPRYFSNIHTNKDATFETQILTGMQLLWPPKTEKKLFCGWSARAYVCVCMCLLPA